MLWDGQAEQSGGAILNVKNRRRNNLRRSVPVALTVVCFATGCGAPEPIRLEVVRPVKTMVVGAGEETRTRFFSGVVEASKSAELAFAVPAVLIKFSVSEGQSVRKGELIAQLRDDEFRARLLGLQGQLDQARAALRSVEAGERPEERLRREAQLRAAAARLTNARAEFDRSSRLVEGGVVSRRELEKFQTAYRVAQEEQKSARQLVEMGTFARVEDVEAREADVRALEGRVAEANIQLADTALNAPFDGVIARRFVQEQQNVKVNQPIVRFQDVDEIDIAMDVPESVMVSDIRTADIVEMVAELAGAPGVQFPVRIREVAQVADPTTQTFNIRVAMRAPDGVNVLPGMTATVTMTYRRAEALGSRIFVPISAVARLNTGEQVAWVLGPDETVTRRPLTLGSVVGGQIEIVDGLQPGDRIAVAGVAQLREGLQVRDLGDALSSQGS